MHALDNYAQPTYARTDANMINLRSVRFITSHALAIKARRTNASNASTNLMGQLLAQYNREWRPACQIEMTTGTSRQSPAAVCK